MFSKEKFKIGLTRLIRKIMYHLVFWNFAFLFYFFLTGHQPYLLDHLNLFEQSSVITLGIISATAITILFTLLDLIFSDRIMRYSPIRGTLFIRSLFYFILSITFIFLTNIDYPEYLLQIRSFENFKNLMPEIDITAIRFMVFFYVACIINHSYKEIHKKIGLGHFFEWFFGGLNKPREEDRVFMFIDMKSSTTLAERLKHKKFSRLVQDVFNDMAVVDNYHGEIYQYLGDGAIISWDVHSGIKNNNCLKAYFAFSRVIEKRSGYYERKYGYIPKFKAGLHVGEIMTLQVGSIRRDISYNGDTINTAARIESMCNELKQDLLISGVLYETLENREEFIFKDVGTIKLKGKQKGVLIYHVKQKSRKYRY